MTTLKLLRPKHYIKNFLLFLPLFSAGEAANLSLLSHCFLGFIAFSALSSGIYIFNDMSDLESDRAHPVKKRRPLACGAIKIRTALAIMIACIVLSLAINVAIPNKNLFSWIMIAAYLVGNVLYSKWIKNVAILDFIFLSAFYLIRLYYGALITGIDVSSYLYFTVLTASLYLGIGKRRNEIKSGFAVRSVLNKYTDTFLDKMMYLCLTCMIIFYALWCQKMSVQTGSSLILFSIPLVIFIFMRYSLLLETSDEGDPVSLIVRDKPLILLCVLYVAMLCLVLYGRL
jgi:4-hydroxybenzoate polyprenyltransferase